MKVKTIPISDIELGTRHRKDMGDLQGLADSIKDEGLLQPVGIDNENWLVFGERRIRAVRDMLGWTEIPAVTVDVSSIAAGEYAENAMRKDFTPSERVAIAKAVEEAAGERRGKPLPDKDEPNCGQLPTITEKGKKTREIAAEQAGFKNDTELRRTEVVVEKGSAALVAALDAGTIPVSTAAKLAELPKMDQTLALKGGKAAIKKALAEAKPPKATKPKNQGGELGKMKREAKKALGVVIRALDDLGLIKKYQSTLDDITKDLS